MSFINIDQIEINKNIAIMQSLTATGIVTQKVYVPFEPDVMVVRGIYYGCEGAETVNTVRDVQFNLTGDMIGSFLISPFITNPAGIVGVSAPVTSPTLMFQMKRPISNDLSFTIFSNGAVSTDMNNGRITIYLDFIKFKQLKQEKVF